MQKSKMLAGAGLLRRVLLFLLVIGTARSALAGPITVTFSPLANTHTTGDLFTVNWVADIPNQVVGWGLDLTFDSTIISLTSATVGPLWFPITGTEADDYGGLAFPSPISSAGVLLATLNFTAVMTGSTTIVASYDPTNLAEGFPLATGGFAPVAFTNALVSVSGTTAPEPGFILLLLPVMLGFLIKHWQKYGP